MRRQQVLLLVCVCLFGSCVYSQLSHDFRPTHPKYPPRLTVKALRNGTYIVDSTNRPAHLQAGHYTFPVDSLAKGEAPRYFKIEYSGQSWVRLNNDSLVDAIVELQCHRVDIGIDDILIPVLNVGGQPSPLKSYRFPFENAEVFNVAQKGAGISITFTVYPDEGEPVGPTTTVTYQFRFQGDHLEQIRSGRSSAP